MMNRVFIDAKASRNFCVICLLMYTLVCIGRNSLSTASAFIIDAGVFDKATLGLMNGLFYVFYALGQVVFGVLCDRISPLKLIGIGIGISAAANLLMPLSESAVVMSVLWCINGMGQSTIFPCVIKMISTMVVKSQRQRANMFLTFTYTASAILTNIFAVYLTNHFTWQGIFVFAAVCLAVLLIVWIVKSLSMQKELIYDDPDYEDAPLEQAQPVPEDTRQVKYSFYKLMVVSGVMVLTVCAMLRGVISISITAWTPTLLMESFEGITPQFSTIIVNIIPIVNLSGAYLATTLTAKVFKNEIASTVFFFGITIPLCFLLINMHNMGMWVSLIIISLSSAFMNSVLQTVNIMLPGRFSKFGCVGTIAGVLNATASAGAALAYYLIGIIAQYFGWTAVAISWGIMAALGMVLCIIALFQWRALNKVEKM